jgi:hypothetical protein
MVIILNIYFKIITIILNNVSPFVIFAYEIIQIIIPCLEKK